MGEYVNIADKHQSKLKMLKENVKDWFEYFRKNNERYVDFMKFICDTALTSDARQKLQTMNKSQVEFNECEAYISRQLGEFSKQQPSFEVRASGSVGMENLTPDLLKTIETTEDFTRHLLSDQKTDDIAEMTMDEMLKGGFSVWRVFTDYENEMSFDQEINVEKEPFPTMCFFDIMAMKSHKGDGDFCGRIIAYKKEDAERMYGKVVSKNATFSQSFGNFNWSYESNGQKIILICEFFKKKKKKKAIVKLSNRAVITKKEYKRLLELWEDAGYIEQPPVIVDERMTEIDVICRYILSENTVLSYEETTYKYLPLVFFDGSSVMLQDSSGGDKHQMTRPYVYHLKGIQEVKNIAGQAMAYEIENTVAHKFLAEIDSIDLSQLEQWRNVQIADVLLYRSRKDGQDEPLPPPREIMRPEIPQIIPHTFTEASRTMQNILGSYDAQIGLQRGDMSGSAIEQGAMHTANAAYPYLRGYIRGLNRVGQILIDLIPKYYMTPRTIPIVKADGKRSYQIINQPSHPQSVFMNFDANMLNISIEAGVNAEAQKKIALNQLIMMCKVSPTFAKFMNEEGLEIFLDNLDIRGIDNLKEKAEEFMDKIKKHQEMMAQKPNPEEMMMQLEQAKIQQKGQEIQANTAIKAGQLQNDTRKVDIEFMNLVSKVKSEEMTAAAKMQTAESENIRSEALMAIELSKHANDIQKDKHDRIERVLVHQDKMDIEKRKVGRSKKEKSEFQIITN